MGKRFKTVFEKISNYRNGKSKIIFELKTIDHDWLKCHLHAFQLWEHIVNSYVQFLLYFKIKEANKVLTSVKKAKKNFKKLIILHVVHLYVL
ncbi:hypothetical protein X975_11783, partial [Stegodyphus mimosarum]